MLELNKICGDDVRIAYPLFQTESSGLIPTSPLQFIIEEIGVKRACQLNKLWHSRLPIVKESNIYRNTYQVCYGALFENLYYGVGIWSSPIASNRFNNPKEILELRRLAISDDAPKYTASRMMSIMIKLIKKKFPQIKRLISYQDTKVHKGTIYKSIGWKSIHKTKFIDWGKTGDKKHRNKSQVISDKIRWELKINSIFNYYDLCK